MTDILLIIFSVIFVYFIFRLVKIIGNARQDARKERDKQNIDLTTQLSSELDSEAEIKE